MEVNGIIIKPPRLNFASGIGNLTDVLAQGGLISSAVLVMIGVAREFAHTTGAPDTVPESSG